MHTIGTNYQEITPKKWRTPKRIARKCQNGAETSNRLLIPNQQFFDKNFYQNTGEKLRRRQRKLMKYKDRLNIPRPELAADKENSRVNRVQRSSRPHPADFLASDMSKWKRDQRIYLSSKSKALLKSRNLWADEDPRARIPLHERSPSNEAAKPRLRKCENYRDVEDLVDEGSLTPGRHNHRENSKKRLFELNKPSLRSKDSKRGGIETDRPDSYFYGSKRSATTRLSNRATNRTLSKERVEQSGSNIYVSKLTNTAEYELHQQYPVSAYGNSVRGSGPGGQGGGNNVNNVNHNTNNVNTNTQSKAFSGLWTSNDYKTPDRRTPQRRVRFSPSPVSERSAPRSRLQSREHSPHRRGLKRGHSFVKTGDNRAMISRLNMAGGNDRQRVRGAQMGQGSPAERAGSPQRSPLMSNLRLNADGYPIEDVCSRKNLNRKAGLPVTQIIRERQEVTIGEPNQPQNEQNPGKGRSALTPVKAVLGRSMRTSRSSNRPSGGKPIILVRFS